MWAGPALFPYKYSGYYNVNAPVGSIYNDSGGGRGTIPKTLYFQPLPLTIAARPKISMIEINHACM